VRLIPQFLRAWHLELFTEPSGGDFLRVHQLRFWTKCGSESGWGKRMNVGKQYEVQHEGQKKSVN
jgi:hypothetical protein